MRAPVALVFCSPTCFELISDVSCVEPLIANGVRCHGGFDEDGQYRSPRTRFRTPAIAAWQRQLENQGHDLLQISPDLIPPTHPSVAQAKLLLTNGAREPIVRALTIISIVEGFGAMIRDVKVPNLRERVADPIDGTALDHLTQGLFEAHARDGGFVRLLHALQLRRPGVHLRGCEGVGPG